MKKIKRAVAKTSRSKNKPSHRRTRRARAPNKRAVIGQAKRAHHGIKKLRVRHEKLAEKIRRAESSRDFDPGPVLDVLKTELDQALEDCARAALEAEALWQAAQDAPEGISDDQEELMARLDQVEDLYSNLLMNPDYFEELWKVIWRWNVV